MEFSKKELAANKYSVGKRNRINVFSFPLVDDYGLGNQFTEVVHDELSEDFLEDKIHLFCVEMEQAKSIFQMAKRSFDPPAHSVKVFNNSRRKKSRVQIGDDRLE